MKILSLFDGMACGLQALKQAGILVTEYHAFEIDKYAIKVAKANHPEIIHHGEITPNTDFTQFAGFDLLIGGSPCQGFSFAGKQLAFDDPRSKLFFEFVRAKNEAKPKYFMLENVRMKKEYLDIISEHLGVQPVMINSALVSAQNRVRYYWANWHIEQPEDRGIILADIIEHGVVDRDKSYCVDANYWKGTTLPAYFEKHRRQVVFEKPHGFNRGGWTERDKFATLRPASVHNYAILQTSERGRRLTPDGTKRDDKNGIVTRGFEVRPDGKSCAITTVQKDDYITEDYVIRKLTPTECERLQTVPDGYTAHVSNTQRYKMLGNGWTVAVIEHIFRQIPK